MSLIEIEKSTSLMKEWHGFVKNGVRPSNLKKEIIKSWERSKELNIDPFSGKSNILLSIAELKKKLEQNKKFIDITKPFMKNIYQTIKGFGYVVFLTDNKANILHIIGDKKVIDNFQKNLNFAIGVAWSEKAVGTTAVSMVISEGNPVPFMAEEKYCFELKKRACSAVPIKNIDDQIIGILGVAANFPKPNCQIFCMLLGAKMAIENQLRMMKTNEELYLISHYYKAILDSVSDAIVTIDSKGIITDINEKAKKILREDVNKLAGKDVKKVLEFYPVIMDVLKTGKEYQNNGVIIDTKNKKFSYNIKRIIPIFDNNNEIKGCINIIKKIEKEKSCETDKLDNRTKFTFKDIIGKSKEIQKVKKRAEIAAENSYNVLITGESGTGKEVFAQAIHNASSHSKGPFIAVNCGAIPKDLIESEFFGYESGAFTGASKNGKPGKFEIARKGTIFLDEIGEMPKDLQIRLLRVLQEKEVIRIGGSEAIPVDVRVIAATNKDLMQEIKKGNFREDLFWRLNVITIDIPSLSQRRKDIQLLMEHFLEKYSQEPGIEYVLDKSVLDILLNYDWPGNVRELENVTKRILAFADNSVLLPEHLPEYIAFKTQQLGFCGISSLEETERQAIERILYESKGNVTRTAKLLGISRPTLYSKLKKYKINC